MRVHQDWLLGMAAHDQILTPAIGALVPGIYNGYNLSMTTSRPPNYIVWSTDRVDLSDPFQRRWYIQQVLTHGRAEDIRALDLDEIAAILDEIVLPDEVRSLWQRFLETRRAER